MDIEKELIKLGQGHRINRGCRKIQRKVTFQQGRTIGLYHSSNIENGAFGFGGVKRGKKEVEQFELVSEADGLGNHIEVRGEPLFNKEEEV